MAHRCPSCHGTCYCDGHNNDAETPDECPYLDETCDHDYVPEDFRMNDMWNSGDGSYDP